MKIKYNTAYQFIAWIVLVNLFLQSCSSLESPLIPINKNPIQHTSALSLIKQIKPLIDKQLIAQGGHIVTFYEEVGELKADVEMNAPQGFSKTYERLNVAIEQGVEVDKLPCLGAQVQARRIHLRLAQGSQPAYIVIYGAGGLLGGGNIISGHLEKIGRAHV